MTVFEEGFLDDCNRIVPMHGERWVIERCVDGKWGLVVLPRARISYKSRGGAMRNARRLKDINSLRLRCTYADGSERVVTLAELHR